MDVDKLFKEKIESAIILRDRDGWIKEPPTFEEFCTSGEYIDKVVLSPLQKKAILSVIGEDPKKIFSPNRQYTTGILCVGKGGGKDYAIAILDCYIITVLLHHENPQRFLNLEENLDIVNVATTKEQATDIFFNKFLNRVKQNRFFLENYKIYEEGRVFNKVKNSRGEIILKRSEAIFPHNIRCFAETSDNESWEGKSVIFYVLDEISGFISEKGYFTGRKIYETATSSQTSRVSDRFQGLGFIISYPRQEKNDIILELYKESQKPENKHMFGMFAFSWDFKPIIVSEAVNNPHFYFDEEKKIWKRKMFIFQSKRFNRFFGYAEDKEVGMEIPIAYEKDFIEKPEKSLTQYCCLPPRGAGDYIEYPDRVLSAINYKLPPLFETVDYIETDVVNGTEFNVICKRIIRCNEIDIDKRRKDRYVAWLDSAEKACDAVIAIGKKEKKEITDEHGVTQIIEKVRIVDVINWTPEPEKGQTVSLINVEEMLVKEIPKYVNLVMVGADMWNSATLMNRLVKVGIQPIPYNLGLKHYDVGKELFYKNQVEIFDEERYVNKNKKELTSLEQLLSLQATAQNVKKQEGFKKDKSDAVIGVINLVLGNLFTKKNRPSVQKPGVPVPIKVSGKSEFNVKKTYSGDSKSILPTPKKL